jgi:hypothetical protein
MPTCGCTSQPRSVNHALEEALDDLQVLPCRQTGQNAGENWAPGASIDLGEAPRRGPLPESPALRLDDCAGRPAGHLQRKAGSVDADEVQTLGEAADGVTLKWPPCELCCTSGAGVCFYCSLTRRSGTAVNTAGA